MPSQRDRIKLTDGEIADFLDAPRVLNVATNGPDGWPHLVAVWYVVRDRDIWTWTYGKSQKVKNLEGDSKATLLVEDGKAYNELRGVMMKCETVIHTDYDTVLSVGKELTLRYVTQASESIDGAVVEAFVEGLKKQAEKRVALQFQIDKTASWDHGKL